MRKRTECIFVEVMISGLIGKRKGESRKWRGSVEEREEEGKHFERCILPQ
jgi:hypothetical protein